LPCKCILAMLLLLYTPADVAVECFTQFNPIHHDIHYLNLPQVNIVDHYF